MNSIEAEQIAALLNTRNQLTIKYSPEKVLESAENYLARFASEGDLVGCVEVKKVQWYQCEILHLTVSDRHVRQGHAKALLGEAETFARARGARVVQCTVRSDNEPSKILFLSCGFTTTAAFFNKHSGNNVLVLQKVIENIH